MSRVIDPWGLRYPGARGVEHVHFCGVSAVDECTRQGYLERGCNWERRLPHDGLETARPLCSGELAAFDNPAAREVGPLATPFRRRRFRQKCRDLGENQRKMPGAHRRALPGPAHSFHGMPELLRSGDPAR
jgi:hypothetical protein